MTTKRKSSFKDKVSGNAHKQATAGANYGYLKLHNNISVFSPDPGGRIKLDFIPYEVVDPKHPDLDKEMDIATVGSLWYKRPFSIHRNIGAANDTVVCLKSIGQRCPICEYRDKRQKEGAEKEELDSLKPSRRNIYAVVPLDSKDHDAKVHIMDISQAMFQKLLNEELEENPDNGIFPDLEEGLTLKVRFDSKTIGKGNPFAEASRIDFIEREEQYTEKILAKVPNLDDSLTILSYEDLSNKFFEIEDDSKNEKLKEVEDEPVRKRKAIEEDDEPVRKRKPVEEDDEPVRKRKPVEEDDEPVRKRPAKIEEDDEPVRKKKPVEDEEEDRPVRRKSAVEGEDDVPVRRKAPVKEEEPEVDKTLRKEKDSSRPGCPHGHKFGVDTDKFDDCDSCKVWNACIDKKEGA